MNRTKFPKVFIIFIVAICAYAIAVNSGSSIQPDIIVLGSKESSTYSSPSLEYFKTHSLFNIQGIKGKDAINDKQKALLNNIEAILNAAKDIDDVQVDVILMQHPSAIDFYSDRENTRFSQDIVYAILKQNRYPMIAIEGSALDIYTVEGYTTELKEIVAAYNNKFKHNTPLSTVDQLIPTLVTELGALRFLHKNTDSFGIGCELKPLHVFQELMLHSNTTKLDPARFNQLMNLRSEIALAKTLIAGRHYGKKKVALGMGLLHGSHISSTAQQWKCGASFFVALSDESKLKYKEDIQTLKNQTR